jgi:hypothetical protein
MASSKAASVPVVKFEFTLGSHVFSRLIIRPFSVVAKMPSVGALLFSDSCGSNPRWGKCARGAAELPYTAYIKKRKVVQAHEQECLRHHAVFLYGYVH